MNKPTKYLLLSVVLAVAVLAISKSFGAHTPPEKPLSDLMRGSLEIDSVEWQDDELWITGKDQARYLVRAADVKTPFGAELAKGLVARGASVRILPPRATRGVLSVLAMLLFPIMIFALLFFFVLRPQTIKISSPKDIGVDG